MVAVTTPNPMMMAIAPDYQVQQQQVERQRALAQALREQSLQDTNPGRGSVSWTQGLARLAQALAANVVNHRADKQQIKSNQAYAAGLRNMFGGQPQGGGDQSVAAQHRQVEPLQAPPPQAPAPMQPQPVKPPVDDLAPLPDAPAQGQPNMPLPAQAANGLMSPQSASMPTGDQQQAAPQQPQRGEWALSGNPRQDMSDAMANWDEYSKALIASHAPTDIGKLMMQAGIDPNTPLGHQIMQQQIAKQNYIAPTTGRPGGWTIFPDGRKEFNPQAPIQGAVPGPPDADGNMTWRVPAGVEDAVRERAQSQAGGSAAGQAPFEMVKVVDPTTGAEYQVPKSQLLGGAGSPSAGTPAAGGGSLNNYYGRGAPSVSGGLTNQSGLGPQAQASNVTAGTNSANVFQGALDGAMRAKDAMRSLDLIMTAAKGLPTGSGASEMSAAKSGFNAFVDGAGISSIVNPMIKGTGYEVGFNRANIAKFDEVKKNLSNLANTMSSGPGSTGTDNRLKNAIDALPGAHYAPAAIQEVGFNMKAQAARDVAYGAAAAKWQQQHGPASGAAFQGQWQQAYNPNLFYHMQKGDLSQWASRMSPAARSHVLNQYRAMKAMGGF